MDLVNSYRLAKRNILVNTDPGTMVFLLLMPTLYLVFMGYMFGSLISSIPVGASKINYMNFLSPGIISFQTLTAGAVAGGMLWSDRRYGMFEQIISGPYTRAEYLLGIMFTTISIAIFGALIMLLISFALVGGISFGVAGFALIIFNLVLGSLFWGAFMLALAAVSKSNQMYNSIQVLILFFASFASTVFYPISQSAPLALRYTVTLNPLTYVADAIRDGYISLFGPSLIYDEIVLALATVVMFVIALLSYRTIRIGVK